MTRFWDKWANSSQQSWELAAYAMASSARPRRLIWSFAGQIYDTCTSHNFNSPCTTHSHYSPARQRWWYTLVNFHWARVRFGPFPLASCGNWSGVNSPTAVSFTVLSLRLPVDQVTSKIPSLRERCWYTLDTELLLKAKRPIRDLTTERESRSNMGPSDILV